MVRGVPASLMIRRAGRSAVWLTAAALGVAPIVAFFSSPLPPSLSVALGVVAVLAARSPAAALLILAALGPLAGAIQALFWPRYDGALLLEVAVLIVISGAALRAAVRGSPLAPTPFESAVLAFISIAIASCAAQMPVLLLRAGSTSGLAAVGDLIVRRFFDRALPYTAVWQTALLVEGAALAVVTARATRRRESAVRLVDMLVAGAAAAAALNVYRLLEISLRNPPVAETFLRAFRSLRINTQYADLNAAGSYFAMTSILAVTRAGFGSPRERLYSAVAVLLGCALWVSGSRVALATTVLCCAGVVVLRHRNVMPTRIRWRAVVMASAAALALIFAAVFFVLPDARHGTVSYSVMTRLELLKTGARMLADRPLFGVGTAQFYEMYPRYASPELQQMFVETLGRPIARENAHNHFLQILAELGVVGLASFGLLLALALWMRSGDDDPWRIGAIAGAAGFLLTCLSGHPLLTPVVAYSFWIVVGLAAAGAPALSDRSCTYLARTVTILAIVLVAASPLRWSYERREADLAGVSLGLSQWDRDGEGVRFRWADTEATLFVASTAGFVRLPLRSPDELPRRVEILLDGREAAGLVVPPRRWLEMHMPLPRSHSAPAFRRLDLHVVKGSEPATRTLMVGRPVEVAR